MSGSNPVRAPSNMTAPTPQNTPLNPAPISSNKQPQVMPSIGEGPENGIGQGDVQKLIEKLNKTPNASIDLTEFPTAVRHRLEALRGLQKEHHKLECEFQQEVLEHEKRFFEKYRPLYEKRQKLIVGLQEPTAEEIEAGKEAEDGKTSGSDGETAEVGENTVKGVPKFWLTVFKNRDSFSSIISERDEGALEKLVDVQLKYLDSPGFQIVFDFGDPEQNPFFSNATLTKTYHYRTDLGMSGSFIYDHAVGEKIEWKNGQDLTVKVEKRTQRNKTTGQTRTITRTVKVDSFFNFFNPPNTEMEGADELDPEEVEEAIEFDYQLGEDLKEKIIPRAIHWFTGEALAYDSSVEDDFDEEEFLSDNDDDDEDDEEDSEEDGADNGKPNQKAAECKQS